MLRHRVLHKFIMTILGVLSRLVKRYFLLRMGQDLAQVDLLAVGPQMLEGIELARLVVEDVHDHAAVVQQHPRAAAVALAVQRLLAGLRELLLHLVAQRVDLRVGRTGADDKILRERRDLVDADELDIFALLAVERLGSDLSQFSCRNHETMHENIHTSHFSTSTPKIHKIHLESMYE